MKGMAYQFAVLRYVHDTVAQEFVNVGVALFAPEAGFLEAQCTDSYVRISQMFLKIDGSNFRQILRYIQVQLEALGRRYRDTLPFEEPPSLEVLLAEVLPSDDSAFRFSEIGVGFSADPASALSELFERMVETYASSDSFSRTDDEVLRVFKEPLDRMRISPKLKPRVVVSPNFEYKFDMAWKNGKLNLYEPVSLDLVEESSILDKANRWVGRVIALNESTEKFRLYLLLGEPREERMKPVFKKALNLLKKIPGDREFVLESDKERFAENLAHEIREHEA